MKRGITLGITGLLLVAVLHAQVPGDSVAVADSLGTAALTGWSLLGVWLVLILAALVAGAFFLLRHAAKPDAEAQALADLREQVKRVQSAHAALNTLRTRDPHFSEPVFLAQAAFLYGKAVLSRGRAEVDSLKPRLSAAALDMYSTRPRGTGPATEWALLDISLEQALVRGDAEDLIYVHIRSSHTEAMAKGPRRVERLERVGYRRAKGALSVAPGADALQQLCCPACAAPWIPTAMGACEACGNIRPLGWILDSVQELSRSSRSLRKFAPYAAEGPVVEETVYAADYEKNLGEWGLQNGITDPRKALHSFCLEWVEPLALRFYTAWGQRDLQSLRAWCAPPALQYADWWAGYYTRYGLRNPLESLRVDAVMPVRIGHDGHFEWRVVRIQASCYDTTVDKQGHQLGGSRRMVREFSEYWTLLRRLDAPQDRALDTCPACAQPLRTDAAGACLHCHTRLNDGSQGWIIGFITRDDAYAG